MPFVKCMMHLNRGPDDPYSKLIHPVHLCAPGGE